MLVLGVDAPGAGNGEQHDMAVTARTATRLPESVRGHLDLPRRRRTVPIRQKHTIEGLVMGDA